MYLITISLLVTICHIGGAWQVLGATKEQKEKWVEPNAWAKEVEISTFQKETLDNGFCICNPAENAAEVSSNNQAAVFIFKKFLRQLFGREKLQYDEQFLVFQRNLLFTILPPQLELLEQLEDPRDLDNVLTEILQNARNLNGNSSNSIFSLIWDIVKDCVLLLRFSEVRFMAIVCLVICIGWFIHRKHNVSIIVMILGGLLIFGYFHTYLECNRELEIKEMIEVIEQHETVENPSEPSWYNPSRWFNSNKEEIAKTQQREKLKKQTKLNLSFCRPDHVLIMYGNDIFMKQLEFLIDKCTDTIMNLKDKLHFPFNYIAIIGLLCMIAFFVKLIFKHILSPRVWTGYFQQSHSHNQTNVSSGQHALPHSNEDRISGENLKMLLNAINSPNIMLNTSNLPTISCVQDIVEALDAPTEQRDSSSSNNSSNQSRNSKENILNDAQSKPIDLSMNSSSTNVSIESNSLEMETSTQVMGDSTVSDFVFIAQTKSKISTEDLPNDNI